MSENLADSVDWLAGAHALADALPVERLEPEALAALAAAAADKDSGLAVACSGGADSLAALLLVRALFPEKHRRILVLNYNHRTRPECDAEAEFVRRVATALGAEFWGDELPYENAAALNEAELRTYRRDFFLDTCRIMAASVLVQGHHADDVVETMLMRLARGSGTTGLSAPRPVQAFPSISPLLLVRPLLTLRKAEIVAALRAAHLPWCEDATNAAPVHLRNRIRHAVVPAWEQAQGGQVATSVLRSRKLLAEDDAALDAQAEALWQKVSENTADPGARNRTFDWTPLAGLPNALHRRVLHKLLSALKISQNLTAAAVDAIVEALVTGTAGQWSAGTKAEGVLVFTGSELHRLRGDNVPEASPHTGLLAPGLTLFLPDGVLTAAVQSLSPELFAQICGGVFPPTETVFLAMPEVVADAAVCPRRHFFLTVRYRRDGDAYRTLGAPGTRNLSAIFIDKKISREERNRLPVVCDATGNILWVPCLPPAASCRLHAGHTMALRLTWQPRPLTSRHSHLHTKKQ